MLDHMFVNYVVTGKYKNVLTSNIFLPSDWSVHDKIVGCASHQAGEGVMHFENDLAWYEESKRAYSSIKCWTWNQEPVQSCLVK
jgi:hypothetical protein